MPSNIYSSLFDSDIIPDEKDRLLKEAIEGFRRGSHLHSALLTIESAIRYTIKDSQVKKIYQLTAMTLEQDRNAILDQAVAKYLKSKEL